MPWRYLLVMLALFAAPAARANYWTPHADIICSPRSNVALVRFGGAADEGPTVFRVLPRGVDGGLSLAKASKRTDCALPNRWRLRLRDGEKQAFAYGMGGADPPAFFSLWINRRHVFSAKEWKPGYGDTEDRSIVALVVRPGRLTWCRAREEEAPRCTSQPFHLNTRYPIDKAEYPATGRKWKVGTLLATRVAAPDGFCERYVIRMRTRMFDDIASGYALFGHDKAPFAWDMTAHARSFPKSDIREVDVAIAPGVPRRLLLWHGENHFFDGDVVFVLPPGTDTRKLLPQIDFRNGQPNALPLKQAPGWTRLVGGSRHIYPDVSPRYVHFVPERIDGRLYFLASPANVDNRPTALLIGLNPAGGSRVMCRLQRVNPHF